MSVMFKVIILIFNILVDKALSFDTITTEIKIDYNQTKEIVQYCLNGLLKTLDVDAEVTHNPRLRLLVVMQNNLNNIVHYKWKVHSEMQIMARAENFAITHKLYEYVEAAITDAESENQDNKIQLKNYMSTNPESSDLLNQILNEINRQNITFDNVYNIQKPEDLNRRRMNDDLEVWEPDEDLEYYARRVSGGKPVAIIQYPFVVSIHVLGRFAGTGCIISKNSIITAASCLQPSTVYRDQSPIQIRIRSEHTGSGGDVLSALAVIFHPRYNSASLENNLAIIKVKNILHSVKRPAIKKIRIGSLPADLPRNFANKGVFILGWGNDQESTYKRSQLSSAFLDLLSLDDCIASIYTTHYVTARHFCAGLVYKGTAACNGDIGSPAIVLGTLVGLVNFGPPTCGTMSSPTVFTKLAYYISWINDVLSEDSNNYRYKSESMLALEDAFNDFSRNENSHEEVLILRQLVNELDKPNNTIAEVIDEDQELDDEMKIIFKTPATVSTPQNPLVNKSIVLIPGIHIPNFSTKAHHEDVTPYVTQPVVDIGLPKNLPYDAINDMAQNSNELRYYVHDFLTKGNVLDQDQIKEYLDLRSKSKNQRGQKATPEPNDNFEYESYEGMSIETPKNNHRSNRKKDEGSDPSPEANSHEKSVYDFGNFKQNVQVSNVQESNKKLRTGDVWSEVVRLNALQAKRENKNYKTEVEPGGNDSKRFRSILIH